MKLDENGLSDHYHDARNYVDRQVRDRRWWWRERVGGIEVSREGEGSCFIPARQLRTYLKRLDAGKGKK
jgi:hypothetical protein